MGHSFATTVALRLAAYYPEKYEAYIGMGVCAEQAESEKMLIIICLSSTGVPIIKKWSPKWNSIPICSAVRQPNLWCPMRKCRCIFQKPVIKAMHETGAGTLHNMKSVITGIFPEFENDGFYTSGKT